MIYLDSAATSLQKPKTVYAAMLRGAQTMTGPGRGGHAAAMAAADTIFACREAVADLFHVPTPEQVVFTSNATHSLNLAISSCVKRGRRVVVSGYEHNSVLRPLRQLGADISVVRSALFDSGKMLEGFRELLPGADLAVCTTMSNVFGFITPIEEIAELCRTYQVPLIVDASQSAGSLPLDFESLGAVYVAMPGHKGLLGPQGTGILLCGDVPEPLLAGGTGSDSKSIFMPAYLPDRAEAGTHNMPGIAGLLAGVRWLQQRGLGKVLAHEQMLARLFVKGANEIPGLQVFAADTSGGQGGVVSVRHKEIDCETLAERLSRLGVAVRGGLHCAPSAHETANTLATGTVRFSFSPFNTVEEVNRGIFLLKKSVNKGKT